MGIQQTLPGMEKTIGNHSTRKALGTAGEQMVYDWLRAAGYGVVFTRRYESGDLRAQNQQTGERFVLEIKTAKKSIDGKWRFTLRKENSQSLDGVDIVILMAIHEGQIIPFVVPAEVLSNQNQAVITFAPDKYKGKLARFRQTAGSLNLEG